MSESRPPSIQKPKQIPSVLAAIFAAARPSVASKMKTEVRHDSDDRSPLSIQIAAHLHPSGADVGEKTLRVRVWRGICWFYRMSDDIYRYDCKAFGQSGSGAISPSEVAKRIWENQRSQNSLAILTELGWSDVAASYKAIEDEENNRAFEIKKETLRSRIVSLEPLWKEHRDKDYWWWRKVVYEELKSSPDFDPEEVSIRRMHYAAIYYVALMRDFEKLKQTLADLEEGKVAHE